MRNARDVNMDSAISIASSVIQCLYDDTQNDSDVLFPFWEIKDGD